MTVISYYLQDGTISDVLCTNVLCKSVCCLRRFEVNWSKLGFQLNLNWPVTAGVPRPFSLYWRMINVMYMTHHVTYIQAGGLYYGKYVGVIWREIWNRRTKEKKTKKRKLRRIISRLKAKYKKKTNIGGKCHAFLSSNHQNCRASGNCRELQGSVGLL